MAEEPMPAQLETKAMFTPRPAMPPIARIAGQTAAEAALQTIAADLEAARAEGRLIEALPLEAIDAHHLVRDRLAADDEEMAALEASLRERGQQVPIEVVDLASDPSAPPRADGRRYGLLSGWRRLTALRQLAQAEPGRFTTVLAIRRRPESSAEAYRAMVEENELRVGLSYYERARIVARAVEQQVFASPEAALSGLFGTASKAKRSKIGSFVRIHEALEDSLRFPTALPERLGLQLARALQDDGFAESLRARLRADPAGSAGAELELLGRTVQELAGEKTRAPRKETGGMLPPEESETGRPSLQAQFATRSAPEPAVRAPAGDGPQQEVDAMLAPGLRLRWREGRVLLTGAAVDGPLVEVLAEYLPEYLRDRF